MNGFIEISPLIYFFAAAAVQLLPLPVLAAAVTAGCVHELSHITAISCCRVPISRIRIGAGGTRIDTADLTLMQEFLCAAAGPAGSLSLLLLSEYAPYLALFGLAQGLFNLLPVYPFDGGRMLRSILCCILPVGGERIAAWIGIGAVFVMIGYVYFHISPVLALSTAVFCLIKGPVRKIPCKDGIKRVQ